MPHAATHDCDFAKYSSTREAVLIKLARLRCQMDALTKIVKAYPKTNEEAGYVDLDNIEQLDCELDSADEVLCAAWCWEFVEWERSRLGVK